MNFKLWIALSFFFTIAIFCPLRGGETQLLLRDNLLQARPGDYLVTAQNKNYTILIIKKKEFEQLSIEEVTIPMSCLSSSSFSWRNWIETGAPGHTSWVMYVIHLPTGTMQQAFSFTKKEWVTISQQRNFLSTLLNLSFNRVVESERKKIGPPPSSDSIDRRSYWQPRLIVEGKAIQGIAFDAWRTRWPKDGSELSGKVIEIYVPKENEKYPSYFPYWLQVSGVVGHAKVRIVDSGTHLF